MLYSPLRVLFTMNALHQVILLCLPPFRHIIILSLASFSFNHGVQTPIVHPNSIVSSFNFIMHISLHLQITSELRMGFHILLLGFGPMGSDILIKIRLGPGIW